MPADNLTIDRIKEMHPKLRQEVLEMYNYANEKLLGKGVRLRFAYTYRSPEEQKQLFKQRPKVTNADSWQSIHNYAMAFDIVLLVDKDGDGKFETASWDTKADFDKDREADWMEVANYFMSKGWEWGGNWKFTDMPHFQKVGKHTWKTLKNKIDQGDYKEEVVNGKRIKYVNL